MNGPSILELLTDAVFNVIATIDVSEGYRTNLGKSVFAGGSMIDVDSASDPTANVILTEETPQDIITIGNGGTRRNNLSVSIEIYSAYNPGAAISDVKFAIGKDPTLGGKCSDLTYNGFSREIDNSSSKSIYTVSYSAEYDELVADPYSTL